MSLRERQQRQERGLNISDTVAGGRAVQQTITTYGTAIHAMVDGEPVRINALGDLPGFSPAYLCIDEEGASVWVPMRDVKVTDPNFLPIRALATRQLQHN